MIRARIVTYSLSVIFTFQMGIFWATSASAQEFNAKRPPPKAKPKPSPRYTPPPPPPRSTPTPSFAMPDDNWGAITSANAYTHSLGLNVVASFFGPGVGLEYIHTENDWLDWGIALRHTQANLENDSISEATEFIKADTNAVRFFARYISYRWLYAGAAFDILQIQGEYGWEGSAIAQSTLKTPFSSQAAALGVFIGTEWEGPWRLYYGADIAGYSAPLYGTVTYEENADLDVTSKALKGDDIEARLREEIKAQLSLYYLNLRVGIRF